MCVTPIQVSDALSKLDPDSRDWSFRSLEYSVLICPFIGVLGGLFFFLTALYIKEDKKAAEMLTQGNTRLCETLWMLFFFFYLGCQIYALQSKNERDY